MARARLGAFLLLQLCGCTSDEEERLRAAQAYLQSRTDVPDPVRAAILEGKVLLGMFPDEAYHAAGAFVYELQGAPEGIFPPDVVFSQRQRPDPKVTIRLHFRNRSQYGSDVPFTVTFQNGRATAIRTAEEEDGSAEARFQAAHRESALKALAESGTVPPEGPATDVSRRIQALAAILRGQGRVGRPEPWLVFEGAAIALGQIGKPALPTLVALLGEKEPRTRWGACIALGVVGPEAEIAVPSLRELLKSKEESDASYAREALEKIGASAATSLGGPGPR